MNTFNVFFVGWTKEERKAIITILNENVISEDRMRGYDICKLNFSHPMTGEKIIVNMIHNFCTCDQCLINISKDLSTIHGIVHSGKYDITKYLKHLSDEQCAFTLSFPDELSKVDRQFINFIRILVKDCIEKFNVIFAGEDLSHKQRIINSVTSGEFKRFPTRGTILNIIDQFKLPFEVDGKKIEINMISPVKSISDLMVCYKRIDAIMHLEYREQINKMDLTLFDSLFNQQMLIKFPSLCNKITSQHAFVQLICLLFGKTPNQIKCDDKIIFSKNDVIVTSKNDVIVTSKTDLSFNFLLVTVKEIDTLFLKHLGKGKFEKKEIIGLEGKHTIYPLTFSSEYGKVNINVIHKSYLINEMLDGIDGIIAVPPEQSILDYHKTIADDYKYIKRLVGSYTPTFIFKDFEKIWDEDNKKERFLEPFIYIIKQLTGITIQ
jgi:hypothetical protein